MMTVMIVIVIVIMITFEAVLVHTINSIINGHGYAREECAVDQL